VIDTTRPTPRRRTRRVGIAEAARILGVSGETVRRRIHAGQIEAVREVRPQGSAWRVVLPVGRGVEAMRGGHATPPVVSRQEPADATKATRVEATPGASAPDLAPVVAALAAGLAHVSGRLDGAAAELGEARRHIRDQAETIGRQGAELAAERERGRMYHAEAERARDELASAEAFRRRNSRRLTITIALVVAATLAIVGMLAPAWVR